MTSSPTVTPKVTGMIWTSLFAFALIRGWLMPLRAGFWLDETGTYYVISGNWHQFLERMSVSIQSPLYCGTLWLVYHGLGSSELILRVPSILAMAVAAFLLYRLAVRLIDPAAGLTAALIFIAMPGIGHIAYQARPYSLTVVLVLSSALYFWRWLCNQRGSDCALCVMSLAAAFYTHPTCGLMVFVYALVVAHVAFSAGRLDWKQIAIATASLAVVCAPILPYYRAAASGAADYSFAERPLWTSLFDVVPAFIGGSLVLGIALLYLIFPSVEWYVCPANKRCGLMINAWLVIPPGILLIVAKLTPARLFVPRYYAYALPALALVLTLLVGCVRRSHQRMVLVSVVTLGLVTATWSSVLWPSFDVDLREGADVLRQQSYAADTPIFFRSGFVEAKSVRSFSDDVRLGFLLAPIHMYPISGAVVALPYEPEANFDGYMANVVRNLESRPEFFLVNRDQSDSWLQWFRLRYATKFKIEAFSLKHGPSITRFRRMATP